jgi:hypothetical protein
MPAPAAAAISIEVAAKPWSSGNLRSRGLFAGITMTESGLHLVNHRGQGVIRRSPNASLLRCKRRHNVWDMVQKRSRHRDRRHHPRLLEAAPAQCRTSAVQALGANLQSCQVLQLPSVMLKLAACSKHQRLTGCLRPNPFASMAHKQTSSTLMTPNCRSQHSLAPSLLDRLSSAPRIRGFTKVRQRRRRRASSCCCTPSRQSIRV